MNEQTKKDRGDRFALHNFGRQMTVPGAAAAARGVFDACGGAAGGAEGWKSWLSPSGKMIKLSLSVMAQFLDDHPDAPAEALYQHLMRFPGGDNYPQHNMWDGKTPAWDATPMPVRAAYEAFRSIYLQMWVVVRAHDAKMARALPPRPLPKLVHTGAGANDGAA